MKARMFFCLVVLFAVLSFPIISSAQPLFSKAMDYPVGNNPECVFAADLDGDTDIDLAVANYNSDYVSVLLNRGDGTFQGTVNYPVGSNPRSLSIADLDGDGDADLAVANYGSDNVSILFNNGDGTFYVASVCPVGDGPDAVFAAYMNSDAHVDLAVANYNSDSVSVLFNNGDGSFYVDSVYSVDDGPTSVFAADLNGDAQVDLAVANHRHESDNVSILFNNGDGTFQEPVNYPAGDGPSCVVAAELNGVQGLDLVVVNHNRGNVSILINNGDGTFQDRVNYNAHDYPVSVFAADLDGDMDTDLAVTNHASHDVSILLNDGNATFQHTNDYTVGNQPMSVVATDLDGDTDLDLAMANHGSHNVSILFNLGELPPGLVAYWSFDEGSGDVAHDYSGNGNDGAIYGANWVDGICGSALGFDGIDDYVFVPDNSSLDISTDGTVMGWIQIPSSFSPPFGGVGFVNKMLHSTAQFSYELGIDHDGPCFGNIGDGVTSSDVYCNDYHRYETPDFLYDDTWHLLALTWNSTELILYIDGTFENSNTNITSGAQVSAWPVTIGRRLYQPTGWEYYDGLIDEVRIYDRALSDAEIKSLYNQCAPPVPVFVDIKPQSCPNPLNIKGGYSKGNPQSHHEDIRRRKSVLPVAILGTEDFDVTTVDLSTVLLEGVGPIRSAIEDVSTPFDGELCGCTTEGADGFDDLTLKFYRQEIVAAVGDVQDGDEVVLTLTGALSDCTPIEGADCVLILSYGDPTVKPVVSVPSSYGLSQNYPNPFNPQTTIRYALPRDAKVRLVVYNIAGQEIETLVNEEQAAGYHQCVWDGKDVASGIYFYRLQAGDFVETRKMVLLK